MATEVYFDLVQFEPTYVKGLYNISEARIAKYNRTMAVFNFHSEVFVEINKDIEIEVSTHYNRLNNNQYNRMLMGLPRGNVCDKLNRYYPMVWIDLKDVSNFPQLKLNEKFCPRTKVRPKFSDLLFGEKIFFPFKNLLTFH